MSDTADLFSLPSRPAAAPEAPRRPPAPSPPLPPTSGAWRRLLSQSSHAETVRLCVTALYTGVVQESFADPDLGHHFLLTSGGIQVAAASSAYGRTIYLTPASAEKLHRKWSLEPVNDGGTGGRLFRFSARHDPNLAFPGLAAGASTANPTTP